MKKLFKKLSTFQLIIISFALIILLGTVLLTLPVSSKAKCFTPFSDALFTATSATCVTGLVVHDTATYWSNFGQVVILLLIQIGGLGIITISMWVLSLSGKKVSLRQRETVQESISSSRSGGIIKFTSFAIKTTVLFELLGAIALAFPFCSEFGTVSGIKYAVFHAVSAFCNAGFDLMGVKEPYSSLTSYSSNPLVNITVMLLIVIGGLGFLTWEDVKTNKIHIKKYRMQSKVILAVTAVLIFIPAVWLFFAGMKNTSEMSIPQRIFTALFQSVTLRTAGFNTVNLSNIKSASIMMMILLMLIGGSPGSTAGGMKTTTLAVLIASAFSVFRKNKQTRMFKRSIAEAKVNDASAILLFYIVMFLSASVAVCTLESIPLKDCLFECASALGTVGLTLGITPQLHTASKLILIALMFLGRVGGLTFIYAAGSAKKFDISKYPQENITVG